MKLPKTTKKQQEILILLYRHRFLNRMQIQSFMGHRDKRRISAWLKDLREKHYVEWIYDPKDFAEKTKPAIYHIGINGVRWLKTLESDDGSEYLYLPEEIRKRYRESTRSRTYIDRCLLLADCCIDMDKNSADPANGKTYTYQTEADYLDPDSKYHFILEDELIHPHLCYSKKETTPKSTITKHYLLEVFDLNLPRYRMSKRLKDYVKYLEEEDYEWKEQMHTRRLPVILIVCPRTTDLIYAKRRTRGLLANIWDDDERKAMHISFTTVDNVKELGGMGLIWERA